MDSIIQDFLEKHIEYVDNEEWFNLFREAAWEEEFSELQFHDLVNVLDSIGCDTLAERKNLFINGFETYYTEADDWQAPEDILDFYSTAGCFKVDYETRCKLIQEWAEKNPGKIEWHWDIKDHTNFEVLCIEDN